MRRHLIPAFLSVTALVAGCSDSQGPDADAGGAENSAPVTAEPVDSASQQVPAGASQSAGAGELQKGMEELVKKIEGGLSQTEVDTAIADLVAKAPEQSVVDFLSFRHRDLDRALQKRIAYLTSLRALETFGSAQTQFYAALFTARGYGVPSNRERAYEILTEPAAGTSRDKLWLTAELMLAKPDAADKMDDIKKMLEEAKALGSGKAAAMLEKL